MPESPEIRPEIVLAQAGHRPNRTLADSLESSGFSVWTCGSGSDLAVLVSLRPWSMVLVEGPGAMDEIEAVCCRVRAVFAGPLAAFLDHADEETELALLSAGVDDVLARAVSPALLAARLATLLRRAGESGGDEHRTALALRSVGLEVDSRSRAAWRHGRRLGLTDLEFDLLAILVRRAGRPVSREELYRGLCGRPYDGLDRSMDLRVSHLRRKLRDTDPPGLIITVRGVGYQLALPPLESGRPVTQSRQSAVQPLRQGVRSAAHGVPGPESREDEP